MLLARNADRSAVDLFAYGNRRILQWLRTKASARTRTHSLGFACEEVDGHSGKQTVAHVQPLRHAIERERDQRSVSASGCISMCHGALQKLGTDASALMVGRTEKLG